MTMDTLAIITTRRSTRKFTPDPVNEGDIRDLLEAGMNAPSAINEQDWQFVVLSGTALEDYPSCPSPASPWGARRARRRGQGAGSTRRRCTACRGAAAEGEPDAAGPSRSAA